jgi:hypothetical protein
VRAQPAVIVPAPDLQQLVANNNINNSSEDPEEAEVVAADKAEETANACACISNTIDLAADASQRQKFLLISRIVIEYCIVYSIQCLHTYIYIYIYILDFDNCPIIVSVLLAFPILAY